MAERIGDHTTERAYESMLADVASHFESPAAIVAARNLRRNQKIALLKQWDYDLQLMLTATEENMGGTGTGDTAEKLRQVHRAMAMLGIRPGSRTPPPSKVHAH